MNPFYTDIFAQPRALRDLAEFYRQHEGSTRLLSVPPPNRPILTGMGASFHAAWIASQQLHRLGIPALLMEATDLLHSGSALLSNNTQLVYVSQSGSSAEIAPILAQMPEGSAPLAVTNDPASPLGQRAQVTLPLVAGEEKMVASKTYINSLAVLWMLARRWGKAFDGGEVETLTRMAERVQALLADATHITTRWLATFKDAQQLVFLGHGVQAATARQAAMMASEWAKVPVLSFSAGAFRHGFIETIQPGFGVVLFAAPGPTYAASRALAAELRDYGAQVLTVTNGETRDVSEERDESSDVDEFLSPMLDVIPAQLFVEALARERGVPPGFRYISKVITKL